MKEKKKIAALILESQIYAERLLAIGFRIKDKTSIRKEAITDYSNRKIRKHSIMKKALVLKKNL